AKAGVFAFDFVRAATCRSGPAFLCTDAPNALDGGRAGFRVLGASPLRLLRQCLSQEKLDVPGRIAVERTEHLVAEPFIKWPRLEAVGLDRRSDSAARARIGLCILDEPRSVSETTRRFRDP